MNDEKGKCVCKSNITKWCISCKVMFCNACFRKHECQNKSFVNGYYNLLEELFQPICEEHDANVKNVCLNCNHRFICCYCLNRDHRKHQVDTIEKLAHQYKDKYFEEFDKINADDLDFSYDDVVADIFKYEEDLALELDARILLKVSSYIKKLTREKIEIISKYHEAADNYKQSLIDLKLTDHTFKESLESARNYLKNRSAFETIALQDELNDQLKNCISKLNVFNVTLVDGDDFDSLGTLQAKQIKKGLKDGCVAFEHDINMENKENYIGILSETNFIIEGKYL